MLSSPAGQLILLRCNLDAIIPLTTVTSRIVLFADGSKKTLGIMLPGDYEFNTDSKELMEVLSDELEIQLPGESWKKIAEDSQRDRLLLQLPIIKKTLEHLGKFTARSFDARTCIEFLI